MLEKNKARQEAKYNADKAERDARLASEKEKLELEIPHTEIGAEERRITSPVAVGSGDSETAPVSRIQHTSMTGTHASQPAEIDLLETQSFK